MKTRALITGEGGAIGSALAKFLEELGWEVHRISFRNEFEVPPHNIDLLVHNAALYTYCPLTHLNDKDIWEALNVNLARPILLTKMLLNTGQLNFGSQIVLLSTIDLYHGRFPHQAMYNLTKAAMEEFMTSMKVEYSDLIWTIHRLPPVETPMIDPYRPLIEKPITVNEAVSIILGGIKK